MSFKHIAEVGCRDFLSVENFIDADTIVDVFEPNPHHLDAIHKRYGDNPNIRVHPVAIWKERCTIEMYERGALTYVNGIESPALIKYGYQPKEEDLMQIEARTIDEFDTGDIELLDVDVEGAEWFVLEKLISRPLYIILETDVNPFMDQINAWMEENGYVAFQEQHSNTFYKRVTC